jgi:AcrR family transcriptional regulator
MPESRVKESRAAARGPNPAAGRDVASDTGMSEVGTAEMSTVADASAGSDMGPVRRRPVQRRSVERFERMLDACAQLLDEVGYDELTTSQVARRAGVPIGTLYQFFDGKAALTSALARRNLDVFLDRLHARFAAAPGSVASWGDAAAAVIAEFVAMKREVPGFAAVDFGDARPGRHFLLDSGHTVENNHLVAQRLTRLGVDDLGLPDAPDVDRALLVAVEAADSVLRLAFRYGPDGDPDLIAEAETLLRGYLAARLP